MKKILCVILTLCMFISFYIYPANAETKYKISEDGLWKYFKYERVAFSSGYAIGAYYGTEKDIVLPEEIDGCPINSVGLSNNDVIENLTIPSCYIDFGVQAFGYCKNLKTVTFSREYKEDDILYFPSQLFARSQKLESVILPNYIPNYYGEHWLPANTFIGCKSLKNVVFPDNIDTIGAGCFEKCSSLTEIVIPEGVKYIGEQAFVDCTSLKMIKFPDSLICMDDYTLSSLPNCTLVINNENECLRNYVEEVNAITTGYQLSIIVETPSEILGDVNGDEKLDITDVTILQKYIAGFYTFEINNADFDGNEKINITDATAIQRNLVYMK